MANPEKQTRGIAPYVHETSDMVHSYDNFGYARLLRDISGNPKSGGGNIIASPERNDSRTGFFAKGTIKKEMKNFLYAFIFFFFVGWTPNAYAQPAFNTGNVKAFFSGLSASDMRTFATELDTNWIAGWKLNFTLTTAWTNSLASLDTIQKQSTVFELRQTAKRLDLGETIDYSNISIVDNGSATTHYILHIDVTVNPCCPIYFSPSLYVTVEKD